MISSKSSAYNCYKTKSEDITVEIVRGESSKENATNTLKLIPTYPSLRLISRK